MDLDPDARKCERPQHERRAATVPEGVAHLTLSSNRQRWGSADQILYCGVGSEEHNPGAPWSIEIADCLAIQTSIAPPHRDSRDKQTAERSSVSGILVWTGGQHSAI